MDDFWQLTMKEMKRIVKFKHEEELNRTSIEAHLLYSQSMAIVEGFAGKLRKFNKYFPGLSGENKMSADDKLKAQLMNIAARTNGQQK